MIIWFKRIALLAGALLLGLSLLLAGAVLWLDTAGYKRLLSWAAEQFLDSQLVIDGALEMDLSRNLSVLARDVQLKASDGSYTVSVGTLDVSFKLGSYLTTGTFWFNRLALNNVSVEVTETAGEGPDPDAIRLPPVVIAQAEFSHLVFAYQELPPGTRHTFLLEELSLGGVGDREPLALRAAGQFEGQPFVLQGTSASIAELLGQHPYPVTLELSSGHVNARLQGTIADPLNGRGLDLQLQADIPRIRDFIEILRDEIPVLGSLRGGLRVRGDYAAPRLEAIDLHLQRGDEVDLAVTGTIDDPLGARGFDLQLEGHSSDPEVLSWLLFKKHDRMQSVRISGRLQGDAAQLAVRDLDAAAETTDGLEFQLNGNAAVHPAGHTLEAADAGLAVKFSTPTLAAANLPGLVDIPDLGAASGTFSLALAVDAIGIYNADVTLGSRTDSQVRLKGDGGNWNLADIPEPSGISLQTDIQTPDLARLGKQLGYPLPELGPARIRGTLVSRGPDLLLQGAKLDIGTRGQPTLHATGMLGTRLRDPARIKVAMDVDIQATELARLGKAFGYTLPELGHTRLTGRLESRKSELLFRDARLAIGAVDQPTIRANGKVTTQLQKGSTVNVTFDVAVADLVAALHDRLPGYLGRLEGDAVISDLDGEWGVERFSLATSQTSLYQLELSGRYDDLVNYDKASIDSSLVIRNPEKLGDAIGLNLSGVGAYQMQGQLNVNKGRVRYLGNTQLGGSRSVTDVSGYLKDGKPVLNGSFEIPVLHLSDLGIGSSGKHVRREAAGVEVGSPYVFSREPLPIDFLRKFDLDLAIAIDEVESDELAIDSVRGKLRLRNGQLSVAPLRLVFEGGDTEINLDVRAGDTPKYRLAVTADDLTLGPLIAQVQKEVPIRGYTNMHLEMHGHGRTPHDIAASLEGRASLALENARIPRKYVELLSVDVFGWVLSSSVARDTYTELNCVVIDFIASAGEVRSELFIADGPRLSLGGQINLDLGQETLDIVLVPSQKKRIFSSISPVKVAGPMQDPTVTAIPARAALQEIGSMALLPAVFVPVRAIQKLWSLLDDGDRIGDGCANIDELREAAAKEAAAPEKQNKAVPAQGWEWE